ncbi:Necrosis and ethylene inducing peptide [Fusarium oxysporum f. sp. albedinis]|nr:Necrosis and ethylene inducing peptide [Fusarium oxysporum f. sp. albedinis]
MAEMQKRNSGTGNRTLGSAVLDLSGYESAKFLNLAVGDGSKIIVLVLICTKHRKDSGGDFEDPDGHEKGQDKVREDSSETAMHKRTRFATRLRQS